jgi:hypothetical protein
MTAYHEVRLTPSAVVHAWWGRISSSCHPQDCPNSMWVPAGARNPATTVVPVAPGQDNQPAAARSGKESGPRPSFRYALGSLSRRRFVVREGASPVRAPATLAPCRCQRVPSGIDSVMRCTVTR